MIRDIGKTIGPILLTLLSATACSAAPDESNVEVTNVKSGLMCLYNFDEKGQYKYDARVCFKTEDIPITGQGRCVFNGENKLCTWYGFEFDYNNKTDAAIPLTCHFTSTSKDVIGNPEGIKEDDFSSYDIMLEPGIHHFSNPQYTLFRYAPLEESSVNVNKCEVEGREVFKTRFNMILPAEP